MRALRHTFVSCILFTAQATDAAPMLISTLPAPGAATETASVWASMAWFDLAAGFTVSGPGRIQHITAALTPLARSWGGVIFGLATNKMIGNAPTPDVFAPVPGSLWEVRLCSVEPNPWFPMGSTSCDWEKLSWQSAKIPLVEMASGDWVDLPVNVPVPSAGDYWLYTRFVLDEAYAHWELNSDLQTTLVARRSGFGVNWAPETTYQRVSSKQAAPAFSVRFVPIPEPTLPALLVMAFGAAVTARRRRTETCA